MAECSHDVEGVICSRKPVIDAMKDFMVANIGAKPPNDPKLLIKAVADYLNVKTELEILNNPLFKEFAGNAVEIEKRERFLPVGPKNTTDLLDNFNIDETLNQLSRKYKPGSKYQFKFYHVPFQMIDFGRTNSELANLSIEKLVEFGYNSFGCVLNTDVSTGRGKHWFCIFWDGSGDGTKSSPWVFEFFNSSGNYPRPEVHEWMHMQIAKVFKDMGKCVKIHIAATIQIQNDHHSCGVYCLAYIYFRLKGKPRGWFLQSGLDDEFMLKFRKKLFREE